MRRAHRLILRYGFAGIGALELLQAAKLSAVGAWIAIGPGGGTVDFVAAAASGAQTVYASSNLGGVFLSEDAGATWRAANGGLCDGMRERVRAPGGTLEFFADDLGIRTVRAALAEIAAGTFDEDERRDLGMLLKVAVDSNRTIGTEMPIYHLRDPLLAVTIPFLGQVPPPDKRTVVYGPDPAAPADLSSWRALAHLPLDLPPFATLPADNPIR